MSTTGDCDSPGPDWRARHEFLRLVPMTPGPQLDVCLLISARRRHYTSQMIRIACVFSVLLLVAGCKKLDEQKYREAGAEAVLPFKQGMKAALMAGLQEGPSSAIAACRVEAPKLAAEASTDGIRVGRTSTKLRNPANAPKPWMVPVLERYEANPTEREPAVVKVDRKTVGYVEPIYVQPLCVTCHGETIAPELQATIDDLYPDDQATGYAPGDLRGVFWVELPRR